MASAEPPSQLTPWGPGSAGACVSGDRAECGPFKRCWNGVDPGLVTMIMRGMTAACFAPVVIILMFCPAGWHVNLEKQAAGCECSKVVMRAKELGCGRARETLKREGYWEGEGAFEHCTRALSCALSRLQIVGLQKVPGRGGFLCLLSPLSADALGWKSEAVR